MSAVVADTHAIVWYVVQTARLSAPALGALDEASASGGLYVPSVCFVEIVYLIEKRRLLPAVLERLLAAVEAPSSALRVVPLDFSTACSIGRIARDEVPDMPDRIIAATALHLGLPLVSRDGKIRAAQIRTIW